MIHHPEEKARVFILDNGGYRVEKFEKEIRISPYIFDEIRQGEMRINWFRDEEDRAPQVEKIVDNLYD